MLPILGTMCKQGADQSPVTQFLVLFVCLFLLFAITPSVREIPNFFFKILLKFVPHAQHAYSPGSVNSNS